MEARDDIDGGDGLDARTRSVETGFWSFVLGAAWFALVVVHVLGLEDDPGRAAGFDRPARVASRAIERELEIEAAVFAGVVDLAKSDDTLREQLEEKLADRVTPLHLVRDDLEGAAESLLSAGDDVRIAAERATEREGELDGERADAVRERAAVLRGDAAELAARAIVLARAAGVAESDLGDGKTTTERAVDDAVAGIDGSEGSERTAGDIDGDANRRLDPRALLALDPAFAAEFERALDGSGEIPARLDGLAGTLLRIERGASPADLDDPGRAALRRIETPGLIFTALSGFAMVGLVLLVATRVLRIVEEPPLALRVPLARGWIGFTAGQIGFTAFGTVLATIGIGGITGHTVALSSLPVLFFAFVAAGWRPEVGVGPPAERLGIAAELRLAPKALLAGLAGALAMWAGLLTIQFVLPFGASVWSNPYLDVVMSEGLDGWRRLALEAGIAAPVFEELAFRAVLFAALRSRLPFWPAAIASAAVFAAAHPYDAVGLISIFWVGVVLAWLYERTGSLVACIVAHSVFNVTNLAIMLLFL
ncbi:MAG: CPBP family glutamic-type intramembrane protease [Planctomycetota bacterium]